MRCNLSIGPSYRRIFTITIFLLLIFLVGKWYWQSQKQLFFEKENSKEEISKQYIVKEYIEGKTILFIGDIMLDRGVEYLMKKNNVFYPFEKIEQFLRGIDIVVGNLEGPIVKNPQDFPDDSLKFAFSQEVVEGLSFSHFNLLSLANNHTQNMGEAGLEETKEFLKKGDRKSVV